MVAFQGKVLGKVLWHGSLAGKVLWHGRLAGMGSLVSIGSPVVPRCH